MSTQSIPQPKAKSKILPMPAVMLPALEAMNQEFCLVERIPGIAVIPTLSDPELHVFSRGELVQTICADRHISGTSVASEWMKWPKHNKAKRLTYAPGKPQIHEGDLNTWVPSHIKPKTGNLAFWNSYLDHVFKSDSTYRQWFIAWLAYQFQHPGTKMHSAVLFWSHQTGTGKSLFGYIMAELFGKHNFSEIGEGDLHGQFNYWATRKQFVMGEEIRGSNAQRNADALKAIITRKNVTINTKNTPHYVLPDCINYFFTSNHSDAFFLDSKDRRFFVHELSADKLDHNYVNNEFVPWLRVEGYSAILHSLLEFDLTTPVIDSQPFNPFGPAPHTRARASMIEAGKDEVDAWLDYLAISPSDTFYNTPGWKLASADELFALFVAAYPRARTTHRAFVSKLRNLCPMVRGENAVPVVEGETPKRLYCPPQGLRGYDGVPLETLIAAYQVGK